ncbi:MAG: hypothetical protein ACRD4O_02920 [Bryobacteraceae bacterium]
MAAVIVALLVCITASATVAPAASDLMLALSFYAARDGLLPLSGGKQDNRVFQRGKE